MPWIKIEQIFQHKVTTNKIDLPKGAVEFDPENPQYVFEQPSDDAGKKIALLDAPAIIFPFTNASDGRAFSWCVQMRKLGYSGLIGASGELGLDRIAYAFRCGFTLVWLSDEEVTCIRPIHLMPFTHTYQMGLSDMFSDNSLNRP